MAKKRFRILPLGYFIMMLTLLSVVLISAFLVRQYSAPEKLYYAIVNKSKTDSYNAFFSLTTMGDAVNYKNKSIKFDYTVIPHNEFTYVKATFADEYDNDLPAELYFTDTTFYYKNDEMNYFSEMKLKNIDALVNHKYKLYFDQLIQIIDWSEPELQNILKANTLQMKTCFNDQIQFSHSSKNDIILTFTLNQLFDALEDLTSNMILHESFEPEILTRISKLYDLYGQSDIIKSFSLNSTIMFDNLVDFKIDFENTVYKKIAQYRKNTNDIFDAESAISIHFTLSDREIKHISLTGELKYKNCDASEWIEWNYTKIPYYNQPNPHTFKTQDMTPYIQTIRSYFENVVTH